jgi:hypothetical protein
MDSGSSQVCDFPCKVSFCKVVADRERPHSEPYHGDRLSIVATLISYFKIVITNNKVTERVNQLLTHTVIIDTVNVCYFDCGPDARAWEQEILRTYPPWRCFGFSLLDGGSSPM